MQLRSAMRIIIVLLTLLICLMIAMLAVMLVNDKADDKPPVSQATDATDGKSTDKITDSKGQTDAGTKPSGTDSSGSSDTAEPVTTEPVTTEPVTTEPVTTEPVTTEPADTDPPEVIPDEPAPEGFSFEKVITTDTGVNLNLRAVCIGAANEDGTVAVRVSVYLDHHALQLGQRRFVLELGDSKITHKIDRISEDGGAHSTLLAETTVICGYGETLPLYIYLDYNGTYSDIRIEDLKIETELAVK